MNNSFIMGIALAFSQNTFAAINRAATTISHAQKVVVAVIDTGADIEHEELKDFIWTNPGETGLDEYGKDKATNNRDDDDNGFVDDLHGWNFSSNTNDVSDQHGHGTHVAGIIKKQFSRFKNSDQKRSFLKLMILKYYNPDGKNGDNLLNSIKAIEYANKMQAKIINYSGGGPEPSFKEQFAIQQSARQGILFIAAAGNNNANTDIEKYYPANYPLENIISVAATTYRGELLAFSNYGSGIDIAAPGKLIYSALPHNQYGFLSGTSQATAYVTGLAARLFVGLDVKPEKLLTEIRNLGTFNLTLKGKTKFQVALINTSTD